MRMRPLKKLAIFLLAFLVIENSSSFVLPFVRGEIFEVSSSISTQAGDTLSKDIDWSTVDWDREIVLLKDFEEYEVRRDELARQGHGEELAGMKLTKHALYEDIALETYHVPEEIALLVRIYREKREQLIQKGEIQELNAAKIALQEAIHNITSSQEFHKVRAAIEETPPQQVIEIKNPQTLSPKNTILVSEEFLPTVNFEKLETTLSEDPVYTVTLPGILESLGNQHDTSENQQPTTSIDPTPSESNNGLFGFLKGIFGIESAKAAPQNPLISYYHGIEKRMLDYALYYLSQQQNQDGSFGSRNPYEVTGETVFILSEVRRTANDQYNAALNYLLTETPRTNREKALKARLLFCLKKPYQELMDEIIATKNPDGGYGIDTFYTSDVLTTLEVILAMQATGYMPQNTFTEALWFILNKIEPDGAMRFTPTGNQSYYLINRTAQYLLPIEKLVVRNGQNTIKVKDKINALLSYLKTNYDATHDLIDELMTIRTWRLYKIEAEKTAALREKISRLQSLDGSFASSVLPTTIALAALQAPDAVLTDLIAEGNLENQSQATLKLTVKNLGYAPIEASSLYGYVESYYKSDWDPGLFQLGGALKPLDTVIFTMTIPQTITFLGQTEFTFYLETHNDIDYESNWITKQFTFASAANGTPAVPIYYIAHKHNVAINGLPSVNVRWQHRTDPARSTYALAWRKKGEVDWFYSPVDNTWDGAFFSGPFVEGKIYEITMGVMHQDNKTVSLFKNPAEVQVSVDSDLYLGSISGRTTQSDASLPEAFLNGYGVSGMADQDGVFSLQKVQNGMTAAWVDMKPYRKLLTRFSVSVNATTKELRIFSRLKEDSTLPTVIDFQVIPQNNFTVKNQKEVTLLAIGSDNIAIKEADFYLWDPRESIWTYLGTESAKNQASVEMNWYVAANLLGQNYKLKTILRDFRGNESFPKEWGPFTILDGTPPVFTISLPDGGETWGLGTNEKIEWTTKAVNGVERVNLSVHYPSASTFINVGIPNTGSSTWAILGASNYAGDRVKIRVDGFDKGNFEFSFDESDDYFSIVDRSPAPEAPWAYPERIPTLSVGGRNIEITHITLESDKNGIPHLIYRTIEDTFFTDPRLITERWYHRIYDGKLWSAEEKIYEKVTFTDPNLTNYAPLFIKKVQFDSKNHAHFLLEQKMGIGCEAFNKGEISYAYFDGVALSKPENISLNATESLNPDFSIDGSDILHVVWSDGLTWDAQCQPIGKRKIVYRTKTINNPWLPPSELADRENPTLPQIAVTQNKVHLTYYRGVNNDIVHRFYTQGAWSATQVISGVSINMNFPQLEGGSLDTLHYVFQEFYSDPNRGTTRNRIMYLSYDGTNWQKPEEISAVQDNYFAEYPRITMDSLGNPHIVFEVNNPGKKALWITKKNGVWIQAQQFTLTSHTVDSQSTGIAFHLPSNSLLAVWEARYSLLPALFMSFAKAS